MFSTLKDAVIIYIYICVCVCVCVNNSKFFLLAYHVNVQKHIDDPFETVFNMMTTQLYSHRDATSVSVMNIVSKYDYIQLLTKQSTNLLCKTHECLCHSKNMVEELNKVITNLQ